jgi:hypothetical protein
VAILIEQGKADVVAKQVPPPGPANEITDAIQRVGYAEGNARKGDLPAAQKIVAATGPAEGRLLAALGVAELLQDNPGDPAAAPKAVPFIDLAQSAMEEMKGNPLPPWPRYQLVKALARANNLDKAGKWLDSRVGEDKRWAELKSWAQLEIVRARLAKLPGRAEANIVEVVVDKDSPARAFAWEAWARHNTRLGYSADVREALEKNQDPRVKALLLVGIALGS